MFHFIKCVLISFFILALSNFIISEHYEDPELKEITFKILIVILVLSTKIKAFKIILKHFNIKCIFYQKSIPVVKQNMFSNMNMHFTVL